MKVFIVAALVQVTGDNSEQQTEQQQQAESKSPVAAFGQLEAGEGSRHGGNAALGFATDNSNHVNRSSSGLDALPAPQASLQQNHHSNLNTSSTPSQSTGNAAEGLAGFPGTFDAPAMAPQAAALPDGGLLSIAVAAASGALTNGAVKMEEWQPDPHAASLHADAAAAARVRCRYVSVGLPPDQAGCCRICTPSGPVLAAEHACIQSYWLLNLTPLVGLRVNLL